MYLTPTVSYRNHTPDATVWALSLYVQHEKLLDSAMFKVGFEKTKILPKVRKNRTLLPLRLDRQQPKMSVPGTV